MPRGPKGEKRPADAISNAMIAEIRDGLGRRTRGRYQRRRRGARADGKGGKARTAGMKEAVSDRQEGGSI